MSRGSRFQTGVICTVLVAGALVWWPEMAGAQIIRLPFGAQAPRAKGNPGDGFGGPTMFVADRTVLIRLTKAQDAIRDGQPADAVRHLQAVLDHPEDFFYRPDKAQPMSLLGVKAEAQRLLGTLPEAGRASYELQYGAEARQLLAEATERGDPAQLATVVRRFFHTQAGYEATQLLGAYYMDRAHPMAAALCFERILKAPQLPEAERTLLSLKTALCWQHAGMPEQATRVLQELKPGAAASVSLAGREVKLFADAAQSEKWLAATFGERASAGKPPQEHWPLVRGNPARTATASGGAPFLKSQWQISTARGRIPSERDPLTDQEFDVAPALRGIQQSLQESNPIFVPAMSPLIVDRVVLFRTYNQLCAVDLQTGEELWKSVETDRAFELLQRNLPSGQQPLLAQHSPSARLTMLLQQRAWQDATYGTLSSNGTDLFSLEDLGFGGSYGFAGQVDPLAPRDFNRITAYDIRTGKLKWEVGGPRGDLELELAGNFFLGPPLPLGKQLYCLAESSNEVRLFALDAEHQGKLEWSQTLGQVEANVMQDSTRRHSGLSPSIADGVLVCPLGAGAVVAVDLTTRQLLWAYRYTPAIPTDPQARQQQLIIRNQQFQMNPQTGAKTVDQWLDGVPLIENGYVLITPRDSDQLHCLRLIDGSLVWSKPRGQGLSIAAVHQGNVIVMGRGQVEALRLVDGTPAWPQPTPIPAPSGRGFVTGNQYQLPLSTAEVATLDLETGRILTRAKARKGESLGNLVCVPGMIVSQTAEGLTGFRPLNDLQVEVARNLERNPDDSTALALRGEIRLNAGQLDSAYADLRRALELHPDAEARQVLAESLIEGLRIDFATYRKSVEEIERLLDKPEQRGDYLCLLAAGLHQIGEHQAAFDAYLRLAAADAGAAPLQRLTEALAVRRDRWVRAQLSVLYSQASAADKADMDRKLRQHWDAVREANDPDRVRTFLKQINQQPVAEDARRRLVELLLPQGYTLEVENQLRMLQRSSRPEVAAFATGHLAQELLRAGHPADAMHPLQNLEGRFADVVSLGDKTGRQLAEQLRADPKLLAQTAEAAPWPTGLIEAEQKTTEPAGGSFRMLVPIKGRREPFFADRTVAIDQRHQQIVGCDGLGQELWHLSNNGLNLYFNFNAGLHARTHNHLLLLAASTQVLAIDTLGTTPDGEPRTLWKESLVEGSTGDFNNGIASVQQIMLPGGGVRVVALGQSGQPLGELGLIQDDCVCLSRGRFLLALEPLTGQLLWQRYDAPRGGELFGDDEFLFVIPPQKNEALVYRISDGQQVGTRPVPAATVRLLAFDRFVLSWSQADEKQVLTLLDVWDQKEVWKQEAALGSKVTLVEGEDVALLEPSGRFRLVRIQDGKASLDSQLELGGPIRHVQVLRSRDHDVVLAGTLVPNQVENRIFAFGHGNSVFNGTAFCFDRMSGKQLWGHPVPNLGLDSATPRNIPVLVFGTRLQKTNGVQEYHVQCLDKRTGRVVLDERKPGLMTTMEVVGNRSEKRVSLTILGQNSAQYDLNFTDKPLPDKPLPDKQ